MSLTQLGAAYGAAYKVCYERCTPDNCTTKERLVEIEEIGRKIKLWAAESPERSVYVNPLVEDLIMPQPLSPIDSVIKRARDRLENHERAVQMNQIKLPIPPDDIR